VNPPPDISEITDDIDALLAGPALAPVTEHGDWGSGLGEVTSPAEPQPREWVGRRTAEGQRHFDELDAMLRRSAPRTQDHARPIAIDSAIDDLLAGF
jgi:hypothetical protein